MAVRESNQLFLQIVGATPATGVPIELDVYDGASPSTMLATIENAARRSFQIVLDDLGAGSFVLPKTDPKNTAAIIRKGNLVRCRVGGVYRQAWWIDDLADVALSPDEGGGQVVQVSGPGVASYLDRAVVYPPVWPPRTVQRVAHHEAVNGGTNSIVVPTAGTKVGDTDFVVVAVKGGSSASVTPAGSLGWFEVEHQSAGTGIALYLFRRPRTVANAEASHTFLLDAPRQAVALFLSYRNLNADPDAGSAASQANGVTANITAPSGAAGLVNSLSVYVGAINANANVTPPTGYTEVSQRIGGGLAAEAAEHQLGNDLNDTGDLVGHADSAALNIGLHLILEPSAATEASYSGVTWGAILADLLTEAQARGALLDLTWDFGPDVDSQGEAWRDTPVMSFPAGTSLLDVFQKALAMGLDGHVTPDLVLQVFQRYQRDLTAAVVFRAGYHVRGELTKRMRDTGLKSMLLVQGAGGGFYEIGDAALAADPYVRRREGFLSFTNSSDPTTIQRAGEETLASLQIDTEAISVPVVHAVGVPGHYEPWQDYRHGDLVTLDVPGTYDRVTYRVAALTLEDGDGADYDLTLDLNSLDLDYLADLKRSLDQLDDQAGRGSTAGSLSSGGGGGGGGTSAGTVAVQAGDTPGFLYDKLGVTAPLTKRVSGGRLVLAGVPGRLNDLTDVNVPTPGNGDTLSYDTASGLWVPVSPAYVSGEFSSGPDSAQVSAPGPSGTFTTVASLTSPTLPAGTYMVTWQWYIQAAQAGSTTLEAGVGTPTEMTRYGTHNQPFYRAGFHRYVHPGGVAIFRMRHQSEGNTVIYGIAGDSRFGRRIYAIKVG